MLFSFPLIAKEKEFTSVIKSWHYSDALAVADTLCVDTSHWNYPMRDVINDYSIANSYNGNLISPIESKIYFDRQVKMPFIFAMAYSPYILTPYDVRFYQTNTPFSSIAYKKGLTSDHSESDLDFYFTGNVTRRTNLGLSLNYLNSPGHYKSQEGKQVKGSVFGSYLGAHYSCEGAFTFTTLSNFENGGLSNPDDLKGSLSAEDMPVVLSAMSGFEYYAGFFNHRYVLTHERKTQLSSDSILTEHIPMVSFMHTFEANGAMKRYIEKEDMSSFYGSYYFHRGFTNDSASSTTIRNTLAVTLEEDFNHWLKFGASIYALNECQRYGMHIADAPYTRIDPNTPGSKDVAIGDSTMNYLWTNNTFIGASIYKNKGKYVFYGLSGDVCVYGYKRGEFHVDGHIDSRVQLSKDTLSLAVNASVKSETPDYFLQHYLSNHYCWDNDFTKPMRITAGAMIQYPTRYVVPRLKFGFEDIKNYIYFQKGAISPMQYNSHLQIYSAQVDLNIRTPYVNLENTVIYQHSSSSALIPLPMVSLYHNLYYHGCWWKALDAQIGVDLRYNTAYYAPVLNPAIGQFCIQDETKVGNYPILNVYANFYVRLIRLKFFFHYTHFNESFMSKEYFSMPSYPYNPSVFRLGLAWHFYK